jgi:hypothetical protein
MNSRERERDIWRKKEGRKKEGKKEYSGAKL